MSEKKPYYDNLDQLTDDLETFAEWKGVLEARIRRAEICFQSSVGLSDERRDELLHQGNAWKRAYNAIVKRLRFG